MLGSIFPLNSNSLSLWSLFYFGWPSQFSPRTRIFCREIFISLKLFTFNDSVCSSGNFFSSQHSPFLVRLALFVCGILSFSPGFYSVIKKSASPCAKVQMNIGKTGFLSGAVSQRLRKVRATIHQVMPLLDRFDYIY